MTLSRTPSPKPNGGWTSRGIPDSKSGSPSRKPYNMNGFAEDDAHWAAARAKSQAVRGYPTIQTKNEGFFKRTRRQVSQVLPTFNTFGSQDKNWRDQEKLGRGRWHPAGGEGSFSTVRTFLGNFLRKFKFVFLVLGVVAILTTVMSQANVRGRYRSNFRLGGGSKFVIILAANEGGGVMDWKGPREWAIERDSVRNKRLYANRWGYNLEIADMSTKKRYAHEWRESWEKVDIIRNCMAKYPKAEWFWWLDLNTFIMEPSISLQKHIFNNLEETTYRDINHYNPLNITHPPQSEFLDPVSRSPTGDNLTSSIDLIISQDCGGFNLGSFFVHRSAWSDRLLDIWWDPVLYEQKHMEWEHKEQDALEHIYTAQPHIRTHMAFVEQRKINSFPLPACGKQGVMGEYVFDERFHYNAMDRDFLVNMAGCEWGRDCWGEMYEFRELSNKLNRNSWQKLVDWARNRFQRHLGHDAEEEQALAANAGGRFSHPDRLLHIETFGRGASCTTFGRLNIRRYAKRTTLMFFGTVPVVTCSSGAAMAEASNHANNAKTFHAQKELEASKGISSWVARSLPAPDSKADVCEPVVDVADINNRFTHVLVQVHPRRDTSIYMHGAYTRTNGERALSHAVSNLKVENAKILIDRGLQPVEEVGIAPFNTGNLEDRGVDSVYAVLGDDEVVLRWDQTQLRPGGSHRTCRPPLFKAQALRPSSCARKLGQEDTQPCKCRGLKYKRRGGHAAYERWQLDNTVIRHFNY